jgi:phage host-nuclease inhibitor protein Gam
MSKKTRIRRTEPALNSRADAERVLGELARATAERDQLTAELEGKLTEIRQRYEKQIDSLEILVEAATDRLQVWAEANPAEFGARKSLDLLHGSLGFRTGNPTLKTLSGWTWDRVQEKLVGPLAKFLRTKVEPDKAGLHSAHQRGEIDEAGLRGIGLRVVQDEAFFIEPKTEMLAAAAAK